MFSVIKYVFLLCMFLKLELLCYRVCLCSAFVVTAKNLANILSEQILKSFPGLICGLT